MAAAAIPVGASLLAPEIAGAAAPLLAGSIFEGAAPWLTGAALGGLGSMITGSNPLQGALLGGIGGGVTNALGGIKGIGGLFDSSADTAATGALGNATGPATLSGLGDSAQNAANATIFNPSTAAPIVSAPAASSSIGSKIMNFAPYAGLAGGAILLDKSTAPKQIGPTPQQHPSNPGPVADLQRQYQTVDPNSYFTDTGNRSIIRPIVCNLNLWQMEDA